MPGSVLAIVLCISSALFGQARPASSRMPSPASGEWPHYTADIRGSKYSPLDQINAANFSKLEVAWRFKTDMLGPRPEYKLEGTPLAIKGVLYTTGGTRRSVIALDGEDGRADLGAQPARGTRAAVAPRQLSGRGAVVLDRRQRRRAHPLRDDRLSARRAQREDRRADPVVRHGRHRRSEGRRRERHAASRSIWRPARSACTPRRPSSRTSSIVGSSFREGAHRQHAQQHQGARARVRRPHRQAAVDVQHDSAARRVRQRDVGERVVGDQRQRRRLDADHGRRGARPGRICRSRRRRRTTTAAIGPATTCSPKASSASI